MDDFLAFEQDLMGLMESENGIRPFVCEGSPLRCNVFVIGFNPASELRQPFMNFWKPGYGFMRDKLLEIMAAERRKTISKKSGKPQRPLSNTRMRIDKILDGGGGDPFRLLETNVYAKEAPRKTGVKRADRVPEHLDFLLNRIKPAVIITHGVKANEYIGALNLHSLHLPFRHLSRASYADAYALGVQARAHLDSLPRRRGRGR
jgi:hypothetical protein